MNNLNTCFEEKIFMKLAIYRNVLDKKNIKDYELIGIVLELIYSSIITINEFLEISRDTIEYKTKNIKYLDELNEEIENIYETLIGDIKKKEAFRKNLLNWVKKYIEYLNNRKKKTMKITNPVKKEKVTLSGKRYISKEYIDNIEENKEHITLAIQLNEENLNKVIDIICDNKPYEEVFNGTRKWRIETALKYKRIAFDSFYGRYINLKFGDYLLYTENNSYYPVEKEEFEKDYCELID
mgnify:CR=1 FL=1